MNFLFGEIPEGWRGGDAVRVLNPLGNGGRGALVNVESTRHPVSECVTQQDDIAAVTFLPSEVEKVNEWLKWWQST